MVPRLTPAQRHLQRLRDRAPAHPVATPGAAPATAPDQEAASPAAPRFLGRDSPASVVLARKLAAAHAARPPANDNAADDADQAASDAAERAALSAHRQLLLQLTEHRRALKDTQSVERKVALKREFLPAYLPWILGVLESGGGAPDEIATVGMIWALDTGDYSLGLELAEHHLRHGLGMPDSFKRDLATYVTEVIAEAAIKALTPVEGRFPHGILGRTELLSEGRDMPDEARAKLYKALGLECAHLADNPPEGHAVAAWRPSQLTAAIACYRRAMALDAGVGVKRAIEILERELKKEETAP